MSFLFPSAPKVTPLPSPPTAANTSVITAGLNRQAAGFSTLVTGGPTGLKRKATTAKRMLIGS